MMKKFPIIAGIAFMTILTSCQNNSTVRENTSESSTTGVLQMPERENTVSSSVTNDKGQVLDMVFNNSDNSAVFTFENEIIHLKGDTMASGIRYSNHRYLFEEWQGHMKLSKDGHIIFEYQQ